MARQNIDVGVSGTPTSGESLRNALGKVNTMTSEIYPSLDEKTPLTDTRLSNTRTPTDATVTNEKAAPGVSFVVLCTSTTRPATAKVGQIISETDTGKVYRNTGTVAAPVWTDVGHSGVTNRGDVSVVLASTDTPTQNFNATLTVNRTVTLPTTVGNRTRFRVSRTAVTPGAFTLAVGTLYTIAASAREWVDVEYDGAAWFVSARGGL